jgi:2-dehydropantoate 2-reductase
LRICIYGAGAVGGYLGAQLSAQHDVTLIARGPHLAAMQTDGLRLRIGGEERISHPRCTDDPGEVGPQDYVIVTLKAHSVPGIVDKLPALLGPETCVVTAVNGIPWWYFYQLEGPFSGHRLESVDPGGRQWDVIGPERALGCVVYPACELVEPGVVEHLSDNKFSIGEPSGAKSDRARRLTEALVGAGFKAPLRSQIRNEIWVKLWGNLCLNPISALTLATLEQIALDPGTRAVTRAMMVEAKAIGEKLGVRFAVNVDQRIAAAQAVGAHKTSMLQDLERDRPMEIDAMVGVVQEMGRLVEVPTPTLDTVLALIRQRAQHI